MARRVPESLPGAGHRGAIMAVMERRTTGMVIIGGLIFVVLAGFLAVVQPDARPLALSAALFFGAVAAIAAVERGRHRISPTTNARLMGAASVLFGVGFGAMGVVAWRDPYAFDRAPQAVIVAVAVLGLVFFGVGGVLLIVTGGRPLRWGRRR